MSDLTANERGLKSAILAGDAKAWEALYQANFAEVYAFIAPRCRTRADTEEIAQEAWLVAVRRLADFHPERGSFANWLKGIATNLLRQQQRHRQRWLQAADPTAVTAPDPAPPDDAVEETLQALPQPYAQVLRGKYLENQSIAALAQIWQRTPKAIESLLVRARAAFRRQFGEKRDD